MPFKYYGLPMTVYVNMDLHISAVNTMDCLWKEHLQEMKILIKPWITKEMNDMMENLKD